MTEPHPVVVFALVMAGSGTGSRDLTATGLPDAGHRKRLQDEWTDWLQRTFRDHPLWFTTLTFRERAVPWLSTTLKPTQSSVRRAGLKLERLLSRSLATPSFFAVMEAGGWNGRLHLHGLISSQDERVIREAMAVHESMFGFTKLQSVSSREGVSDYVTKYVFKTDDPWWVAGGPLWRT